MSKTTLFLFTAVLIVALPTLRAQHASDAVLANQDANINAYVDLLRTDIQSYKVQALGAVLQMSPEEAATFWPIYRDYDAEMAPLGKQRAALIKDYVKSYDGLTDAKADEIAQRALDLEAKRYAVKVKFYGVLRSKMGSKAAARFLQVENQLLALISLKVASMLPAVE